MKQKNINLEKIKNENLLEKLIQYNKYHGIKEEQEFLAELEKAIFLLPVKKQKNYPKDFLEEDGIAINFLLINQPFGNYLPAFTTLDELKLNIKDSDIIPLTYEHLVDLTYSNHSIDGFYINPYSLGMLIDKETMKYFSMTAKSSINTGKKIIFGEPMEYPTPIISIIINILKDYENISKAYFLLMQVDDNLPEFLLVIDGNYEEKELYDKIQMHVNHLINGETILNITNKNSYIGKQAIDDSINPIYSI